ncbi:MAG: AAA family ATPase [Alphaproteobacteria bacterium]|nr:AAA family ATPase [Alphaproteobacteria bacterium]
MYERFYGLSAKPFSLLPDGDFLYPSRIHKRVSNLLDYGVESEAGFIVVTGEVGTGKTTIVRRFLKNTGPNHNVGVITNPSTSIGRLLDWIAMAFDLKERGTNVSDATLYNALVEHVLAQYGKGRRTTLLIDEAQNLRVEMLEELRMLSNINNERDLLLQIVLVGQPELLETLKRPGLRQFVQRISVHCHLGPLTPPETAAYIRHRLGVVGGKPEIFDDMACAVVHHFTGGTPRLINLLCDQSMVYAYSEDRQQVTFETVAEVAIDRAKYGLSAFRNVPEMLYPPALRDEVRPTFDHIQRGMGED